MTYVSYLSALRTLRNFGIILLIGLVLFGFSYVKMLPDLQHGHFVTGRDSDHGVVFEIMTAVACSAALIIATLRGSTLDNLARVPAITFTRPQSRLAIALRDYAVDAVTIVASAVMVMLVGVILVTIVGAWPYLGGSGVTFHIAAAFAAVILMWYGQIALLCALFPGRGGAMIGASWAFAVIAPGLSVIPFPNPVGWLFKALLYLDPLAYISSHNHNGTIGVSAGGGGEVFIADPTLRFALAGVIGIVTLIIATRLWATKDAVA